MAFVFGLFCGSGFLFIYFKYVVLFKGYAPGFDLGP